MRLSNVMNMAFMYFVQMEHRNQRTIILHSQVICNFVFDQNSKDIIPICGVEDRWFGWCMLVIWYTQTFVVQNLWWNHLHIQKITILFVNDSMRNSMWALYCHFY